MRLMILMLVSVTGMNAAEETLVQRMARLDREMFEAYNKCDLERFGALFTEGVEFYHDQGGLTLGRARLVESVKANICGKVRRELVAGTLKVYPMKGFGAVAMGSHRFYPQGEKKPTGIAQFVHLWKEEGGVWRVTRVISYDHQPLP